MSDDGKNRELEHESGTQTLVQPSQKTKTPPMYKVVILNDDFTPREFVVHILKKFFNKDEVEAHRLMMQVHHSGSGVAGIFTHEIAETKSYQINSYSQANQYPLKSIVEEA